MKLSARTQKVHDSITMKLNEKALALSDEGRVLYNLSAGQLPLKPSFDFIEKLHHQLNFLKSFQYSPSAGFPEIRKKLLDHFFKSRKLNKDGIVNDVHLDVIVSNGSKHSIYNTLGAIIDPGDEVIIFAPYWVSYPEMIKFWDGIPIVVQANIFDAFLPSIDSLKKAISSKTKAIIINSPNNPSGVSYSAQWMKELATFLNDYEDIFLISDEIYSEVYYFDPKPTYFYQIEPSLLSRTIIINGISKMLAATGLRMGWVVADDSIVAAMKSIQGQTTSAPNSLVQRALYDFNFFRIETFLAPVKFHLRQNAECLREKFREVGLGHCWYQSTSAFYFMIDFSRTPMFERFSPKEDHSHFIADEILDKEGILVVPGSDFGMKNSARISLVIEEIPFREAVAGLVRYLLRPS